MSNKFELINNSVINIVNQKGLIDKASLCGYEFNEISEILGVGRR